MQIAEKIKRQLPATVQSAVVPVNQQPDVVPLWGDPGHLKLIVDAFIDQQDVTKSSRDTYGRCMWRFQMYLVEHKLQQPTPGDLLDWKRALEDSGLSPYSRALYQTTVKKFFQWTAKPDVNGNAMYPNIAGELKAVKKPKTKSKDCFSVDQLTALLSGIDRTTEAGKRDYAITLAMLTCGLRDIEIVRANVEHVTQSTGVPVLRVHGKGRTASDEVQILTPPVRDAIDDYLATRGKVDPDAPLFVSVSDRNRGGRLTPRSVSRIIKQRAASVGIRNRRLTAHSLRHTAITLAVVAGSPLQDVQIFARHLSVETTLGYFHAVNRLGSDAPEFKLAAHLEAVGVFG